MADALDALLRANVAGALAILAVLALRPAARRCFGAEVAYGLWLAPALAVAGSLLPARLDEHQARPLWGLLPRLPEPAARWLLLAWAAGAVVSLGLMILAQLRFTALARIGRAGPAVIGLIAPRIIMPADDGAYTAPERTLIRAHERRHIVRRDPQARVWIALFQCAGWFNPLVHLAARAAVLDQELACDAAVLRNASGSRATYASALLKAQVLTARAAQGVQWAQHPLETRILAIAQPTRGDSAAGPILVGAGVLAAALLAWSAKPPVAPYRWVSKELAAAAQSSDMSVMIVRVPKAPAHRGG